MDVIRLFSGGFPLTTERLNFLQNTYTKAIKQLSGIAGSGNLIIDGAVTSGSNISAGTLIIDGEVVALEAGVFNNRMAFFETVNEVPYNEDADNDGNLDLKVADVVRTVRCASSGGSKSFQFSTLKRIATLQAVTPVIGDIKLIYRDYDPAVDIGWRRCDGQNGTPNFLDRFLVGTGVAYDVGTEGGSNSKTISQLNLPNVTLTGTTTGNGAHTHTTTARAPESQSVDNGGGSVVADNNTNKATISGGNHTHGVTVPLGGSGQSLDIRPLYKAVTVLIYVG